MRYLFFLCWVLPFFSSCTKNLTERREVYFNDFSNGQVPGIEVSGRNGAMSANQITTYNGNEVFGPFHNGTYVQVALDKLPLHNRLKIEFDLYVHGGWRGNEVPQGFNEPDYWVLAVDGSYPLVTTFSNLPGFAQSFPLNYQPGNNPFPAKGNAWEIDLPPACSGITGNTGTTLYRVDLFHFHSAEKALIAFTDQMRTNMPLCAKGWSIDNVRITAMEFK